jgi:hypothetical protein
VKKAIDRPVFLKRKPVKNANIKKLNSWIKNPPAKLIFRRINGIVFPDVFDKPRIRVPMTKMMVRITDIRKINWILESRNS